MVDVEDAELLPLTILPQSSAVFLFGSSLFSSLRRLAGE
jgi:hypothetical protein